MSSDEGLGIETTERGGYSYVTGFFRGTATLGEATFGEGEPNETILTSAGNDDIFVAKYDHDGALLWATRAGSGSGRDHGVGIATTDLSDSYVTGFFSGTATFGEGEPNETTLTSLSEVIFVAKYDRDGALVWATSALGHAPGSGIATTRRGDTYVTGFFQGPAIFGEGEPNETTLTATGTDPDTFLSPPDIFVAKYDGDGMLLWATKAGGVGADEGLDIATTQGGDSYVTGFFRGTATFGEGEPNETTLTSTGERNIFVAKYDRDGALVWATRAGGAGILYQGSGIATTELGDSYVTGIFTETATFGEGEPNETTLTSVSDFVSLGDIFVAKYDRDGALLWATQAGGALTDASRGIATTASGESYVTGIFTETATFGESEPNETTLIDAGGSDIFVAKYDRDGALLWATRAGGAASDAGFAIATTASGESYVTGRFRGIATFGEGEPNETTLTSPGPTDTDIFVAKYR